MLKKLWVWIIEHANLIASLSWIAGVLVTYTLALTAKNDIAALHDYVTMLFMLVGLLGTNLLNLFRCVVELDNHVETVSTLALALAVRHLDNADNPNTDTDGDTAGEGRVGDGCCSYCYQYRYRCSWHTVYARD